jgi:type III pantothenate kinase
MLLAVDIGNTSTKFGLFDGTSLSSKFTIPTDRFATPHTIALAVADRIPRTTTTTIVCSVVPSIDDAMRSFLESRSGDAVEFVDNSSAFQLKIDYQPQESLGTDRLVGAYAAVEQYGAPCIVCSLGTATTIDVVTADREFLGGVIAPGADPMAEALHMKAPRLPKIDFRKPTEVLGNSTVESIASGLYYGYVSMVEGLITRIRTQSGVAQVIGTGGNAVNLEREFDGLMIVDANLVLQGLRILATR